MTLIDIVFIGALIIGITILANRMEAAAKLQEADLSKDPCPPHKWNYEMITNQDGTSAERMRCSKCRTFPGQ